MSVTTSVLERSRRGRSNKHRGAAFERRVMRHLEDDGWVVVRAAGSLGPTDLVAMRPSGRTETLPAMAAEVRFIGVKLQRVRMGPAERETLAKTAWYAGATPWLASRGPKPRCPILQEPLPRFDAPEALQRETPA